jgi:dissimilatory sulfite reductase related protein
MNDATLGPRTLPVDAYGFLRDPMRWNAQMAADVAHQLGIGELAVDHWRVIEHLRTGWLTEHRLPVQRLLCRDLALDDQACVTSLFGGLIEAWKVSGLPDPGEEARVYMEDMERADTITPEPTPEPPRA